MAALACPTSRIDLLKRRVGPTDRTSVVYVLRKETGKGLFPPVAYPVGAGGAMTTNAYASYRGCSVEVHVTTAKARAIGGVCQRYRVSWTVSLPEFPCNGLRVFPSGWISLLSRKHSDTSRAERIPSSIQFSAPSQRGRWRIRGDSAVSGQGHCNIPPARWRRVWAYCATLGDFARARFYSQQLLGAQPMARQGPLI